jgi:Flp pilus assembly protein TadD
MYVQHNDPGIKAMETWSMMCQIVMVVIFPAFVYTNFKELIPVHLPIYKVFHKAQKLPIYLIHIGIFLVTISWVFALNTAVFHQIMAAKSNQEGDSAFLLKKYNLAEIHYKNALIHSKLNTKSNICLAQLAQQKNVEEEQAYYLSNTLVKNPQAETYVALSNLYAKNDHLFESLFNLKKGLSALPNNHYLMNQLAINYEKLNQIDSAKYFYQMAYELALKDEITKSNYLYFETKYPQKQINQDLLTLPDSEDRALQNNFLLYSAVHNLPLPKAQISADFEPQIDVRDWALLYNTSSLIKGKSPLYAYSKWKKNLTIQKIFPEVAFLEAWQNYYHHKPLVGLNQLSLIIAQDTSATTKGFQNILGFWKEKELKSISNIFVNSLHSAKIAIESNPFNIGILQKAIPILNQNKEEKLAYYYALSALRYNEQVADFYSIYAFQALELAELTYAKESMQTLKKLNPDLYQKTRLRFDTKMQEVLKKQQF